MAPMIMHTAGKWDSDDWPMYFAASNLDTFSRSGNLSKEILLAINDLKSDEQIAEVSQHVADGKTILIDSGVYWLSTQHANAHNISMNEALGLAPDKIDGFADLFRRYCELIRQLGDQVWGYIEIDQGGKANKIKTRERLESLGMRPIPVYHPLNDGWDYFDELATKYDRICFGNLVMADAETRRRLIATAWERRRKYPHLWIHCLGVTPSELTTAYPMNSCDSSSWIRNIRWGHHVATIANSTPSQLGKDFIYKYGDTYAPAGHRKAVQMAAYDVTISRRTMLNIADEQETELGCDIGMFDHAATR